MNYCCLWTTCAALIEPRNFIRSVSKNAVCSRLCIGLLVVSRSQRIVSQLEALEMRVHVKRCKRPQNHGYRCVLLHRWLLVLGTETSTYRSACSIRSHSRLVMTGLNQRLFQKWFLKPAWPSGCICNNTGRYIYIYTYTHTYLNTYTYIDT